MKKKLIVLSLLCLVASSALAKQEHKERSYQKDWCSTHQGKTEVVLPDKTRCDCITETHAIEFDFASKWAEAIGQSLYYSVQTGKRAGIVLIMEQDTDYKYWIRLNTVIREHGLAIDTWQMTPKTP